MEFKVTKAQLEQLANYLARLPYIEVRELIDMLQKLPVIQPQPACACPEKEKDAKI
jgi:hypothetical protein